MTNCCYICNKKCAQEYVFDDAIDIKCSQCDNYICYHHIAIDDWYYSYYECIKCIKKPKTIDLVTSKEYNAASNTKVVFHNMNGDPL